MTKGQSHNKIKDYLHEYLDIRMAIVWVIPGETKEDAWSRHLLNYPEDFNTRIRIFNYLDKLSIIK